MIGGFMKPKTKDGLYKEIYERLKKDLLEGKYEYWIFKSVGKDTYFFDRNLLPVLQFDHSVNADYVSLLDPIPIILEYKYDQEILNCNAVFFSDDGEPILKELSVFPKHKSDENTDIDFYESGDSEKRDMVLDGIRKIVPRNVWGELIQKLFPIWKKNESIKEKLIEEYQIQNREIKFIEQKKEIQSIREKAFKTCNAQMDEYFYFSRESDIKEEKMREIEKGKKKEIGTDKHEDRKIPNGKTKAGKINSLKEKIKKAAKELQKDDKKKKLRTSNIAQHWKIQDTYRNWCKKTGFNVKPRTIKDWVRPYSNDKSPGVKK